MVLEVEQSPSSCQDFFDGVITLENWCQQMSVDRHWCDGVAARSICNVFCRPIVIFRKASQQRPTVFIPNVVGGESQEIMYMELDEVHAGCEHYNPLVWKRTRIKDKTKPSKVPAFPEHGFLGKRILILLLLSKGARWELDGCPGELAWR